jgi:signal transduction histidine kinase/CheY-like chemotaxis protein
MIRTRWRSLPLALQLAFVTFAAAVAWAGLARVYFARQDERRAHDALMQVQLRQAQITAGRMGTSLLTMAVLSPRGGPHAGAAGEAAVARIEHEFLILESLPATDTAVAARVAEIRAYAARWRTAPAGRSGALVDDARRSHQALLAALAAASDRASEASARRGEAERTDNWRLRLAVLGAMLTLILVNLRVVTEALRRVIDGANALAEGRYHDVRGDDGLHRAIGGSAELAELSVVFDRLALAIEEREQVMKSDLAQLREVEQMKTDFVSTVSHELRTPLTSMRGALSLVLAGMAGPLPDKASSLMQIAFQNTERLIRLINDILDIEKIEAGHVGVRRERCDLVQVLRATLSGLEAYFLEAGVQVTLAGDARGAVTVTGDSDRLVQVFTNLVSNAVKFSPKGEAVRVAVETDGAVARVRVSDRGPGIPPEFQGRIFGKFQQAARADARRSGGTGLGLAIARAIVELHGGGIRFETVPGAGTTFIVELPYVPLPAVQHLARGRSPEGRRLMVVDEDVGMLSVLETLCQPLGNVATVRSGEEALALARGTDFDAFIVDPQLPGMSGLDLVRRLRGQPAYHSAPVLIFSGREFSDDELAGITLSPAHAFVKSRDREQDLVLRLLAVLTARGK